MPRSRFAPLAIALPLVLGLWLTIGLPILAELSSTAGGGGSMRDFFFDAEALGGRSSGAGHLSRRLRRRLPPPPPAPPPQPPPGLPAPADVQTVDHGQDGRPETGDELVFTFAGPVGPDLILGGWDGSATAVTVHFEGPVADDTLTVRNASDDSLLTELGSIQLNRDYASSADFSGSLMTLSGNTITIVLGTPPGTIRRDPSAKDLVWATPHGTATESGHPDSDF